jgi:hypothetical protein
MVIIKYRVASSSGWFYSYWSYTIRSMYVPHAHQTCSFSTSFQTNECHLEELWKKGNSKQIPKTTTHVGIGV